MFFRKYKKGGAFQWEVNVLDAENILCGKLRQGVNAVIWNVVTN